MSWSAFPKNEEGIGSSSRVLSLDEIEEENFIISPNDSSEVQEQVEIAFGVARQIVSSGVVGDPYAHKFHVSLYGHANLDHAPAAGWANDMVTVSIAQAKSE